MKIIKIASPLLKGVTILISFLLSQLAYGHGAVSYPVSRQLQCFQDGAIWGPIENVPNAGCRASLQISQQYPFVQWPEVAANPKDPADDESVKEAVPDSSLCAAGDKRKIGLDAPQNAGWKMTDVESGKPIQLTWVATAAHNPATYRVYITRQDANFQGRALHWDDLTLIASGQMPSPAPATPYPEYRIPVTLPANRTGTAILYSVWQRIDAGNEGFFNCSDIRFDNTENPGTPEQPADEWIEDKAFINPAFPVPREGDRIRFRLMDGSKASGQELVDINISITTSNESHFRWAEELASVLNEQDKYLQVGIKDNGNIQFDSDESRIHQNLVWVKDARNTSYMEYMKPDEPGQGPDTGEAQTWPAGIGNYKLGETVVKGTDGNLWRCRPFPQGGWCNINNPVYEPGGKNMIKDENSQAWERVK